MDYLNSLDRNIIAIKKYRNAFLTRNTLVECDSQSRLVIPKFFMEYYNIDREVVMILDDGKIDVWDMFLVIFVSAQEMLVGSYNIRYKNWNDSVQGNIWPKRCQVICDQINFMSPVIFGTQEVLYSQLLDMHKALDGYDYIGLGRDDGKHGGEHEAIFYKKDKLQLLDHGDFWLNETPDKPALGWDAACIRICTWGKFSVKTAQNDASNKLSDSPNNNHKTFYYFNLHMDHVGVVAGLDQTRPSRVPCQFHPPLL